MDEITEFKRSPPMSEELMQQTLRESRVGGDKLIDRWKAETRAAARRHGMHVNDYWQKYFREIAGSEFTRFP